MSTNDAQLVCTCGTRTTPHHAPGCPLAGSPAEPPLAPGAAQDGSAEQIVMSSQDGKSTPVDAPAPQTLEEYFEQWFERFNAGLMTMKPGFISWRQADELLSHHAAAAPYAGMLLSQVECWTRHMHARPTPLPSDWLTSGAYIVDVDGFRGRPAEIAGGDLPSNWFGVEVPERELQEVLNSFLQSQVDPGGPPQGDPPRETWGAYGEGRATKVPFAEQDQSKPPLEIHLTGGEALPQGSTENCPLGFRVVATPEGYVGVWYGPLRRTEAAAVADTWRQEKS